MKTKTKTANDLAALKVMTPKQLRERYAELYGEPSRSGNKQWLIRRCAWRIQALAEGGLSERAERRARQLARDQDLRVIPPKDLTMDPLDRPADVQQPARRYIRRTHDAGTVFAKGQISLAQTVSSPSSSEAIRKPPMPANNSTVFIDSTTPF